MQRGRGGEGSICETLNMTGPWGERERGGGVRRGVRRGRGGETEGSICATLNMTGPLRR